MNAMIIPAPNDDKSYGDGPMAVMMINMVDDTQSAKFKSIYFEINFFAKQSTILYFRLGTL